MSRVLGGILSISPPACGGDVPAALTRLWVHEVQRVFGDRLVCEEDRGLLRTLQQELLVSKFGWAPGSDRKQQQQQAPTTTANAAAAAPQKSLFGSSSGAQACVASDALFDGPEQVLFGDFSKLGTSAQERVYEPLAGMAKLAGLLERYLDEYNISGGKAASAASAAAAAAAEGGQSGDGKQRGRALAGRDRGSHMDLVFFQDAVLHVVRLARVLRQPR
jgi:dynein heavy chain